MDQRRWMAGLALCAVWFAGLCLAAPAADAAPKRAWASYGVLGKRTLHATVLTQGVPRKARVVLETRDGARRAVRPLKPRGTKLRWRFPASLQRLTIRTRVMSRARPGRKPKRLVATPWKTLAVGGLAPAARVRPIKPSRVLSAPTAGSAGTLVVQGRPRVNAGEVLAIGLGPATPDGLLARVVSVAPSGTSTTVDTVPATLPEVVPVGQLDLAVAIDEPASAAAASPLQKLAKALECTDSRQATAEGEASISAGLALTTAWRTKRFSLPKLTAKFSGDVRATLRAGASVSGEATCTLEPQPLFPAPVRLHTIATSIGPVPVVGVVNGQVYLSGSAVAKGRIETSIKASAGASAGVEYDGSSFKPFGTFDKGLDVQPPTVSASGSVEAHLAPTVELRLYGLAGPEIDFSTGLKLAADILAPPSEPWWRLTAPLDLGVRMRLKAWQLDLESDRFSVWNEEPELLRATAPPGGSQVVDLGPSPEPLPEGIRTRLTWDSNSDVDLHTWDVDGYHAYWEDLYGIESGFLDQDVIPGYGPETFQETDPGHTFTFGVCQYGGLQANVTVDVRDPDGATRRFLVTLRGRKAASLLTFSPNGSAGYVPDPDWCDSGGGDPTAIGETTTGSFEE